MVMGLLPEQFWDMTMREFIWYNNGYVRRNEMAWQHTSSLMALQANIAGQGKGKRFSPDDFNPYSSISTKGASASNKEDMKALLDSLKKF